MHIILKLASISHCLSITATQFFLIIFTLYLVYGFYKKRYKFSDCPYIKFYLLLLVAGFLSVIFGVNPKRSILGFRDEWLLFYFFVGYFIIAQDLRERVFNYIILGGIVASFYGFYQYFFKHLERAQGFFSHSLTFGNVMSILSIMVFSLLLIGFCRSRLERIYYTTSLIIFILSIYISGGRGPLIFTMITICITIVLRYGKKGLLISSLVFLCFLVLGYYAYNNPAINRRLHELANESIYNSMSSIGTRIALWKASFEIFLDYPLFGIGYSNFKSVVKEYLKVPVLTTAHAHNAYIQYLVLHGIIGLLCLLTFFYNLLKSLIGYFKKEKLAIVGLSVLLVFLLQGILENNFYDSEVAMIFWYIIGSVIGIIKNKGTLDFI
ncbi:MAG: O-antigen ligase family protein [Proteobacteria bacterium]|nr:O-antigen ligase family protein [Pseudomonadota bacterium]